MPEGTPLSTTGIPMPPPDPAILARRQAIIDGLAALVPAESLIVSEDERRAYETDAFTASTPAGHWRARLTGVRAASQVTANS